MMAYTPQDPAYTSAFSKALKEHRSIVAELLNGADALQEQTYQALKAKEEACGQLDMKRFEVALGCGTEAAHVCAEMAGYKNAADGQWYTDLEGAAVLVDTPQDVMRSYHLSIADVV